MELLNLRSETVYRNTVYTDGSKTRPAPVCNIEGCTKLGIREGFCVRHGAKITTKSRCTHPNCMKQAKYQYKCVQHGGNLPEHQCNKEGCSRSVFANGMCRRHNFETYEFTKTIEHSTAAPVGPVHRNQVQNVTSTLTSLRTVVICTHDSCEAPQFAGGYCRYHVRRRLLHS